MEKDFFEKVLKKYELSNNTEKVDNAKCRSDQERYFPTLESPFEMAYLDLPEPDWRNYRYKITNET